MADLFLKKGREKSVQNRHPWVFSGAVDRLKGDAADGDVVTVRDTHGQFLAYGYLNTRSQIVIRLLSWDPNLPIDEAFWQRTIASAVARRQSLADDGLTTAYRLIYAESDLLPGLIVDRYGEFLVIQCLTLGIAQRRSMIVQILANLLSPGGCVPPRQLSSLQGIYERSDVDVRRLEGLEQTCGVLYGDEPPPEIEISENGHRFLVDLKHGQKTGFYLDQRENRQALARWARGRSLLNVFSYSGAFSVYAAGAGAGPVFSLDSSEEALALAKRNMSLNGLHRVHAVESTADEYELGSAFDLLREYRDRGRSFDLIVLDPPKFAPTHKHAQRAARAYKDINLLAFKLLPPGGMLCTFSCSAGIDAELFQKIVFGASLDARRDVQIVQRLAQGPDHPVLLSFPESAYLKGLICRVLDR